MLCFFISIGESTTLLKMFFDRSVTTFELIKVNAGLHKPKPLLKGKKAIIVTSSAAPFPLNQLLSQSRGAIISIKNILKAGGLSITKIINVARSNTFGPMKKQRYIALAKKIGSSFNTM